MNGPVQTTAEIFSVTRVGEYVQFTVVAPDIAARFEPGHFVAVAVGGENTSMILRRAFALCGATPSEKFAGTVQFVVAEHGPGTRWLVQRRAGETLDIVGPLGTPFPLPSGPAPAVLVGGGYGSAPLLPLAQALLDQGSPVEIVLGAATAGRLFGELAAKRLVGRVGGRHRRRIGRGEGAGHRPAAGRDRTHQRRDRLRLRPDADAPGRRARSPRSARSGPRWRSRSRWPAASGSA